TLHPFPTPIAWIVSCGPQYLVKEVLPSLLLLRRWSLRDDNSPRSHNWELTPGFELGSIRLHFPSVFSCLSLVSVWGLRSLPGGGHIPGNLPYEYKIVIAGNHELTFDKEFMADLVKQDYYRFPSVSKLKPEDFDNVQSLLTNSIYLQDSEVTVKGFRIYGAPWNTWCDLPADPTSPGFAVRPGFGDVPAPP
uniref:Metallophosphoesterase domain containing 2 n=1 Tax=Equus caballus TaxID=9796 RepID=A0A9L0RG31_HORSE